MNADQFRDYMLSFLLLLYPCDHYVKKQSTQPKGRSPDILVEKQPTQPKGRSPDIFVEKQQSTQPQGRSPDIFVEKTINPTQGA
jgi:hypothetical protein